MYTIDMENVSRDSIVSETEMVLWRKTYDPASETYAIRAHPMTKLLVEIDRLNAIMDDLIAGKKIDSQPTLAELEASMNDKTRISTTQDKFGFPIHPSGARVDGL